MKKRDLDLDQGVVLIEIHEKILKIEKEIDLDIIQKIRNYQKDIEKNLVKFQVLFLKKNKQ